MDKARKRKITRQKKGTADMHVITKHKDGQASEQKKTYVNNRQ